LVPKLRAVRSLRSLTVAAGTALVLLLFGASGSAGAAGLATVGTFTEPMFVTSPPTEPNRLLVVERSGRVVQVEGIHKYPFADLRTIVDCCVEDRGLQSIALSPEFTKTGAFYLDYTDSAGNIVVAEMRAQGREAPLSTLRTVLTIPYTPEANHYGGQVQFGPEGDLYISTGDGGYGGLNDEHHNAQSLEQLKGKMLRIDPRPSGALPYTVPVGNPFASLPAPYDTIWSYGLRNPYRFSFDPPSNSIVIPDVGELKSEEVDMLSVPSSSGANFGWNCKEGNLPGPATDPECATPPAAGYISPIFEYGHTNPGNGGAWGCAIIGGYVVRDQSVTDLYGRFVYADFCTAEVRSFNPSNPYGSDRPAGFNLPEATSFGEDSCDRVYAISKTGTVSRIVGSSPAKCSNLQATKLTVKVTTRKVRRGGRALIVARVSPCEGRTRERALVLRGAKAAGGAKLNKNCVARLRPRVTRTGNFRVKVKADKHYKAAISRPLRLMLAPSPVSRSR
jgi:hypothetical protein